MNLANWYKKLNEFLSPSVMFDVYGGPVIGSYRPPSASSQPLLQQQLLDAINQNNTFKLAQSTNNPAVYTPNNFTANQIGQLPMQLSPSMLQAYNAKMQGYGITPQPFNPALVSQQQGAIVPSPGTPTNNSATAPSKGGK